MTPLVSVVVVSYRRFDLLRQTVAALRAHCDYPRLELVLADDGSPPEMQEKMRELGFDVLCMSAVNRGIGANTNAGLRAASGELILQLQDDFVCTGPNDFLRLGVKCLLENPDIGLVRYTKFEPFTEFERRSVEIDRTVRVMSWQQPNRAARFLYSDTPHLKRRSFHERLGFYIEGIPMERTETEFCRRFNSARVFRAAALEGYDCFRHTGEAQSHRPRTLKTRIANAIQRVPVANGVYARYRELKARLLENE